MTSRIAFLALLPSLSLVLACSAEVSIDDSECEPVGCRLYCEHGFLTGESGCEICECAPPPAGCVPVACKVLCANGFQTGPDGCEICECVPDGGCQGPDPAGCSSNGCPPGEVCDTELGCLPSGCDCDVETGSWGCTADCGGGVCVPDPTGCSSPYPGGCVNTACPIGQVCQQTSGLCVPSSCTCEAQTGVWSCTDDCGGGLCVDE